MRYPTPAPLFFAAFIDTFARYGSRHRREKGESFAFRIRSAGIDNENRRFRRKTAPVHKSGISNAKQVQRRAEIVVQTWPTQTVRQFSSIGQAPLPINGYAVTHQLFIRCLPAKILLKPLFFNFLKADEWMFEGL